MKTNKKPSIAESLSDFLSNDCIHEELINLPNELQNLFDLILDTEYGNCLQTRRKMLRIKEMTFFLANAIPSFSQDEFK